MALGQMRFRQGVWILLMVASLHLTQCRTAQNNVAETSPVVITATNTPEIGVNFATIVPATAVFIQTTPTALPTITPTPTPTPIVYTIVAGDTLLALAWQQGNTVAEIEALNPGIVPESLQIGQQIVLPPPATPLAQQFISTPIPMQVAVTQIHAYQTPVGSLWLVGEVFNQSEYAAEAVQVEIALLDEANNVLHTTTSWIALPIIPAYTSSPFGVLVPEPPAAFAYPVVSVVGGETVMDLGTRYLDLVVTETAVSHHGERVQISGQITNSGGETVTDLLVVAALYNAQGDISGYAQLRLDTTLAPGDNTTFTADVTPPGSEVVTAQVMAQGKFAPSS